MNKLIKTAVNFGIILSLTRVSIDTLLKLTDTSAVLYYSFYIIAFVIEIILVIVAIKYFKYKVNEGFLNFADGIKIGMVMLLLTGALMFAESFAIKPDFGNTKAIEIVAQFNPDQLEQVESQIEEAEKNPNYFAAFPMYLLYYSFIGFIISVIPTSIMVNKKPIE